MKGWLENRSFARKALGKGGAMTTWLKLDATRINPPRKEVVGGVEMDLLLSPHDVPQAVRGSYDAGSGKFTVEFRYIGEEPLRARRCEAHQTFYLGKQSGRLYKTQIDVRALESDLVADVVADVVDLNAPNMVVVNAQIPGLISDAIKRLDSSEFPDRRGNYDVARNVISTQAELFQELPSVKF